MWLMTLDGNSAVLSPGRRLSAGSLICTQSVRLIVPGFSHPRSYLPARNDEMREALSSSTALRRGALAWPLVVRKRVIVYTTSSATNSRPFIGGFACHFTPRRSLKTYVVSFVCCHDSARSGSIGNVPGVTPGPVLVRTR